MMSGPSTPQKDLVPVPSPTKQNCVPPAPRCPPLKCITQWGALPGNAGKSSAMNQVLSPVSFLSFLTASLGRITEEDRSVKSAVWVTWLVGVGSWTLYILGSFSGQRKGKEGIPASEAFHIQDHPMSVLTFPGDLRIRGPGSVSHAGHLWEAWEHNPPAFDPLITHHRHSELESLLLPITIHKLGESTPAPPRLQICQDMGLDAASPHPPP